MFLSRGPRRRASLINLSLCMFAAIPLLGTVVAAAALVCDGASTPWEHAGPAGYDDGNQGIASSGAAQAATHLTGTKWLLATANGGIWATDDITASPEPRWTAVLDSAPVSCSSISAMSASVNGTVLAGCGAATSSEMGLTWDVANSGDWGGVMVSKDEGKTWAMTGFPANFYVSSLIVVEESTFFVGVRSHMFETKLPTAGGGIFKTTDGGKSWVKVFHKPVFDLRYRAPYLFVAVPWADDNDSMWVSADDGSTFSPWATGISWGGRKPFYPNFALGKDHIFLGALTVSPSNLSDTSSQLHVRSLHELVRDSPSAGWLPVANAPRLDEDGMPKDRMALLVHPSDESMLFVAGNAGALAWRVDWQQGVWTETFDDDTSDHSAPHGDCRNYYWEPTTGSLILLNDGGAHLRTRPSQKGGKWTSLSGDTGAMELISAHYEPTTRSWVGGAQDNCVQYAFNASATTRAIGFIEGDGTVTAVDTSVSPPRFYGATQFLGNFADDDAPHANGPRRLRLRGRRRGRTGAGRALHDDDDNDDDDIGFGYATYDAATSKLTLTGIPVLDWFDVSQFPFFDHPYALNTAASSADGLPVVVWARAGRGGPSGFYTVQPEHKNVPPQLVTATEGDVYRFVAGGVVGGQKDASVLVGMNNSHLLFRSNASGGKLSASPLPTTFAKPIEFRFSSPSTYVLGPVSHDRTVSMAVDPTDARTVAVSGWTTLLDNTGAERVHLTKDAGHTFIDITGDLAQATGVCTHLGAARPRCGKWRPSALLILPDADTVHVLVGTVSGVYATSIPRAGSKVAPSWSRLGGCEELPLVLIGGLSYEPSSDTAVAATMGRGVYLLHNAKRLVREALAHS